MEGYRGHGLGADAPSKGEMPGQNVEKDAATVGLNDKTTEKVEDWLKYGRILPGCSQWRRFFKDEKFYNCLVKNGVDPSSAGIARFSGNTNVSLGGMKAVAKGWARREKVRPGSPVETILAVQNLMALCKCSEEITERQYYET